MVPVISSEARNPGQKTKISQSQSLTSFETRSFEMTNVDLWRLSAGFRKRPHARLGGPHSDRNFENPYIPPSLCELCLQPHEFGGNSFHYFVGSCEDLHDPDISPGPCNRVFLAIAVSAVEL